MISPTATVRETLARINLSEGFALIVDEDRHLLGTVTDGDIRRAVLANINLEAPVQKLIDIRNRELYPTPVTAPAGTSPGDLLGLMTERLVRQVPLLDKQGRVVDLALLEDLVKQHDLPLSAVVMAGGFGTRMRPLTDDFPKPMLPIGDKPVLQLIIEQLQSAGISKVQLTTHFKPDVIRKHFGDGKKFGVDLQYVNEDQPLGTAGALGLVPDINEPMLVLNGDVLTQVDFRALVAFHREHKAELTVGVRQYDFQVPYGVVQCEGAEVQGVEEKPTLNFFVNAGIYLLEPSAHRSIPTGQKFDMTDLIGKLRSEGRRVVAFPVVEYWMDIGRHVDYEQAQEDVKTWKKTP